jgi:hypothetical protein
MADYYWTKQTNSGTGNWSNVNMWASTSGGVGGTGAVPTSSDNVHFDANSFASAGQVATVDVYPSYCNNMDWTGALYSPTLTLTNALLFYGNIILISAMTVNGASEFRSTYGAQSFTTGGCTLQNTITLGIHNDSGNTVTFQDNFTTTGNIYLSSGTLNTNGKTVSCNVMSDYDQNSSKTLNISNSTITCYQWSWGHTGLTLTSTNSTITMTGSTNFDGGGYSWNTVIFTGSAVIDDSSTFTTLSFQPSGIQTITFTDGTTQTVINFTGTNGTNVITMQGSSTGGWNLTKSGGGVVSMDYLALSYSQASPSTLTWYAGTHSTNTIGNSGWIFTAPPAASEGSIFPLGFIHGR